MPDVTGGTSTRRGPSAGLSRGLTFRYAGDDSDEYTTVAGLWHTTDDGRSPVLTPATIIVTPSPLGLDKGQARGDLTDLLLELFLAEELRHFIATGPQGEKLSHALPTGPVSTMDLAVASVGALDRHGEIDDALFARLRVARPGRVREIERVARTWSTLAEPPAILASGTLQREITAALMRTASNAESLHHQIGTACRRLGIVPPNTILSFEDVAKNVLQSSKLYNILPQLATDLPDVRDLLNRLWLLLGFLRTLVRMPGADRLARPIALLLEPDLPSRHEMLAQLQPGTDFFENLAVPLLDLCLRKVVEPRGVLVRIARGLVLNIALHGEDMRELNTWLQQEGGVPPTAGTPALRVMSVRLVGNEDRGWTVCWIRGVSPGLKTIKYTPEKTTVADIHGLWNILRPAAADLVSAGFVAATDQLILSIEIESSRALDGFHRATDRRRCKQFWAHFGAVTLWPWFDSPDDIAGLRHSGLLHRPTLDDPSETMALYCRTTNPADLRASIGNRVMLVCTEPVWRSQFDGFSTAIATHENRTVSVLVAGDDGEAFLDCLFAQEQSRPFHDVFRATKQWLTEGKDLHILWTDPDYKANPAKFEMLFP